MPDFFFLVQIPSVRSLVCYADRVNARHIALGLLGGGLAALLLVVSAGTFWSSTSRKGTPTPSPSVQSPSPLPDTSDSSSAAGDRLLLTRDDDGDGQWDDVSLSDGATFRSLTVPDDTDRSTLPVWDGRRLYVVKKTGERSSAVIQIVAREIEEGTERIVTGSTPLVTPRGVFASPEGDYTAFFLDNAREPLTELWTYDPAKGEKRLALERLSRDVRGPFWAPDGGFLVLNEGKILRGSPHRTGTDILPATGNWFALLPGEAVIPSPDGTQVISIVKNGETSTVHIWDATEGQDRVLETLPGDTARFLGWTAQGTLLAVTDEPEPTLWKFGKTKTTFLPLGEALSSIVLSGDGTALAYITDNTTPVLVIRDAETLQGRTRLSLLNGDSDTTVETRALPRFTVRQYLRLAGVEKLSSPPRTHLAEEDIVRYGMEHIREIAEAPPGEPVTAERVWVTKSPGIVLIDYRVGTTLWRRSVRIDATETGGVRHTVLGIYAPAAGEWVLTRGIALPQITLVTLYEFEPELEQWVRKETTTDIHP